MKLIIGVFIFLSVMFYQQLCFSQNDIKLRDIDWDLTKEQILKSNNIKKIIDEQPNQLLWIENINGKDIVVSCTFDDTGKLLYLNEVYGNFKSLKNFQDFQDRLINQILTEYITVESLEELYDAYKDNIDEKTYNSLIKVISNEKWNKFYKNSKNNLLLKNEDRKNDGIITIRYESKDWVNNLPKNKSNISDWETREEVSKLDNTKNIYIRKKSNNTLINSIGKQTPGYLYLRCLNNETGAYIEWPNFIGINGQKVKYKLDNGKIEQEYWDLSNKGTELFPQKPITFLKNLKGKNDLIIRTDTYHNISEELEFTLEGIDEHIDKVAEYCNWNKNKK